MIRSLVPYAATFGLRPLQRWLPDMLWRVATDAPVVYLTFDDGPTPGLTDRIVEILARHDALATHFLVGAQAANHPSRVRMLVEAGHAVGNHTYTHPDAWSISSDMLTEELDRTTALLQRLTDRPVSLMRPPYGHPTRAMRRWCRQHAQRMVMWDVMPGDYLRTATASGIERFVIDHVRAGSIVVLHDNPICEDVTPQALDALLSRLSRDGYVFAPLAPSSNFDTVR